MTLFGDGFFLITSVLSGSGLLPFSSIICSKYLISFMMSSQFSEPSSRPYSSILWNTALIYFLCCLLFSLLIRMSSRCAVANSSPANIESITCWNKLAATFSSKGRRFSLKSPLCVLIANNFDHSSATFTCRYASDRSILEKIPCHHLA